jgi:tetratricopeptide (TPR) repeat protein
MILLPGRGGPRRGSASPGPRSSSIVRWLAIGACFLGAIASSGCGPGSGAGDGAGEPGAARADGIDAAAVEAALAAAEDYLDTNDVPRAEAILARLVERAPRDWRAREMMGRTLGAKAAAATVAGRADDAATAWREASEQYARAVEGRPDSAGLRQSAGVVAMMAGEQDVALAHFEAAAAIDPSNPQHPLYAAQIRIARGDLDGALVALERVLVLDPDEAVAHASLAMVALESGDAEAARARIAEARTIAPGDLRFRVQEAIVLRRTGDAERALVLLASLSTRDRAERAVAEELAASFETLGRAADAAEVWEHVLRVHPDAPDAWRAAVNAGEAHVRAGNRAAARRQLDHARLLAGDVPEVVALDAALARP